MRFSLKLLSPVFCLSLLVACDNSSRPAPDLYQQALDDGWSAFTEKSYTEAKIFFNEAKSHDAGQAGAFSGLGWVYLMQDSLNLANQQFSSGAQQSGADADFYAGWALVLNLMNNIEESTAQALQALALDVNWQLAKGTTIDTATLYLLLAENYFLTGHFSESLSYVQKINPAFSVDVFSAVGKSLLSQKIEQLSNDGG